MRSQDNYESTEDEEKSPLSDDRPHEWYDDDFCSGGGKFVGKDEKQTVCPVCGEVMDVDEDGYMFKHRPRIPKNPHGTIPKNTASE